MYFVTSSTCTGKTLYLTSSGKFSPSVYKGIKLTREEAEVAMDTLFDIYPANSDSFAIES